jgi:hypothetical protein
LTFETDGYPDLLLLDKFGKPLWESLASRLREKKPFSPFATGGIEIKATVGSVPTPEDLAKKKMTKPDKRSPFASETMTSKLGLFSPRSNWLI